MFDLHPDDQEQIDDLRRNLLGHRVFLGYTQKAVANKARIAEAWVGRIERGDYNFLVIASVASVAKVFRRCLNVTIEDLDLKEQTPELTSLENLVASDPFNGVWLESLVQALLRQARAELDIPANMMAAKLDMRADRFTDWEAGEAGSASLPLLMSFAREMGGRLKVDLARVKTT